MNVMEFTNQARPLPDSVPWKRPLKKVSFTTCF
jgi:hypothetical protein